MTATSVWLVDAADDEVYEFNRRDYPALASDDNARAFCAAEGRNWLVSRTSATGNRAPAFVDFFTGSGLAFDFAVGDSLTSVSCGDLDEL